MKVLARYLVGRPLPVQAPYTFVRLRPPARACGEPHPATRARCRAHPARLPRQ